MRSKRRGKEPKCASGENTDEDVAKIEGFLNTAIYCLVLARRYIIAVVGGIVDWLVPGSGGGVFECIKNYFEEGPTKCTLSQ